MLDSEILDQARRLIEVKFAERRRALPKEVDSLIQNVINTAGTAQCSVTPDRVHTACAREVDIRAKIVSDSLLRVHKAHRPSNILATDLKEEVHNYIEAIVKEVSKFLADRLRLLRPELRYLDLESTKLEVTQKMDVEVDLYVDSLAEKPTKCYEKKKNG